MKTHLPHSIPALLLVLVISSPAWCQNLPADVNEILEKLEQFETQGKKKYEDSVTEKRKAVAKFLESRARQESKSGNEELASSLLSKAEELESRDFDPLNDKFPTEVEMTEQSSFHQWLETVTFRANDDGRIWWVEGDTMFIDLNPTTPGANPGTIIEIDDRRRKIHFKRGVTDEEGMYLAVEHNREQGQIMFSNGQVTAYLEVIARNP